MGGWNKMGFKKIDWEGVEWIHLAQDRDQWWVLVSTVMNLQVLVPKIWLVGWLVSQSVNVGLLGCNTVDLYTDTTF
jgi:hypothetical protein